MKRTPLKRRTPMRWKRKPTLKFPDGLHDLVVNRDGMCFVAMIDSSHVCEDQGGPHESTDLRRLTVDHFWLEPGGVRSKRAPHTPQTLTAMCWKANFDGPSREIRTAQREYSERLYGRNQAA